MNILVIDAQGGGVGKQLVSAIKQALPETTVTAVGANCAATQAMIKSGADKAATGENAVVVACRHADIVVGPIGIVVADSLGGEITPKMAVAIGQCRAVRMLIPINQCDNIVVGVSEAGIGKLVTAVVDRIRQMQADAKTPTS